MYAFLTGNEVCLSVCVYEYITDIVNNEDNVVCLSVCVYERITDKW